MKTSLFLLSLVFITSCKNETNKTVDQNSAAADTLTFGPTKASSVKENKILTVEDIKKEYGILNGELSKGKLDSLSFKYECDERSGEVTFYSDKEGLKIIKHFYAEYSHFSSVENYFIKNETPFFILKEDTSWSFDDGTPEKPETKDDIIEQRIYLQNGKAIKCLEKNYMVKSSGSSPDPGKILNKEIQCSGEELLKTYGLLLKSKEKRGEIKCL
ncbi:hypothetical protein [Chryseobacterium populi]|uniref:Lipoprotein n=1 Tax=Chryseobacterium populi TaxID=1144316 RepID=J3CBI8_9FLAO|nr:hypothetical protein [Chryseobacterium populi]EJL68264.1 hypothetical protein PMI13_03792 [Chryseobacterium populi]